MSDEQEIPAADPGALMRAQAEEIRAAMERVLMSGYYVLGPEVTAFEEAFAKFVGVPAGVGVANGTDALELALRAVGVQAGDRVATVANTVTATVAAIGAIGAEPVFVEIDEASMTMEAGALETTLRNTRVRAVVPVHLYGQMADMTRIGEVARAHEAAVVEDCAQAHGATWNGVPAGAWGDAAAFSFYPTKNLGALGDGGAVVSRDGEVAERVRRLRQYGWRTRYVADEPGRNSRLDEVQAAILRVKLTRLAAENARRAAMAERYLRKLAGLPLRLPTAPQGSRPVWHQFAVRTSKRDALRAYLAAGRIGSAVLYPVPLHWQPAHRADVSLPFTEQACAEVLCLPVHPTLRDDEVERVIAAVQSFFA
jgi:dTDP-4-amino-4,6-dideoxygalactose transaminase